MFQVEQKSFDNRKLSTLRSVKYLLRMPSFCVYHESPEPICTACSFFKKEYSGGFFFPRFVRSVIDPPCKCHSAGAGTAVACSRRLGF